MTKPTITVSIPKLEEDGSITRTTIQDPQNLVFDPYVTGGVCVYYAHIVKIFGLPTNNGDTFKIDALWFIDTPDGIVMLHNLMSGPNFLGQNGKGIVHITDWCIRAENSSALERVDHALA
jgi:hypothetical protein